jgi:hypothetical protein
MARQKKVRLIQVLEERGVYGKCSCNGDILFYSDYGVRCKECGKLYGLWYDDIRRLRSKEIIRLGNEDIGNL